MYKVLKQKKRWLAKRICLEYRRKKWSVSFIIVNDLLRKIQTVCEAVRIHDPEECPAAITAVMMTVKEARAGSWSLRAHEA